MHVPEVRYHDPETVAEASSLMAEYGRSARLMAGGTDLLVVLKTQPAAIQHIVSLKRLKSLGGVRATADAVEIGALTTPAELNRSADIQHRLPSILDATQELGAAQIRNMATVGGNLASAVPSADLPPILTVLDAEVILHSSQGERTVPLRTFFRGPRQTVMNPGDIITSIRVPVPHARRGASFYRIANRQANACAVAGVAASVTMNGGDTIRQAHVVLCAVAPTPHYVAQLGELLKGQVLSDDLLVEAGRIASEAAVPISDVRSTADYRRQIVAVLTRRALATAARRAREVA